MLGGLVRPANGAAAVIGAQPARYSLARSSIDDALNLLDRLQRGIELTVGGLAIPVLAVSFLQFLANSWTLEITESRMTASRRYGADEGGEA
jgi:hypothetical protein